MARTIKRLLITIFTAVLFCLTIAGFSACKKNKVLAEEYQAHYGERFILPLVDGGTFTVKDSDGEAVEIFMGGFTVNSKDDYTLTVKYDGGKDKATIKVLERAKSTIGTASNYIYASLNVEKQLPTFTVAKADGTQAEYTTKLVSPSGETVGENLISFTPTELGNYVLTATTESGESKSIEIEVGETAHHEKLLARMGKADSKDMVVNTYGVIPSVNTEDKKYIYGAESGSLRFRSTGDAVTGGNFQLTNFAEPDITEDNGFYFFIYNDATVDLRLIINQIWAGQFMVTLRKGEWTPIMITDYIETCQGASNPVVQDRFSDGNLNGLHFYYDAKGKGLPQFSFYMSDIYRMPKATVLEVNKQFSALPAASTVKLEDKAVLEDTISRIELMYYSLSESERTQVNYQKAAQIRQRFVWLENPEAQANQEDDVVVYFNSEVGFSQTSIRVEPQGDIEKEITSDKAYGSEGKSLHLYLPEASETESRYSFDIHVNVPMITNFTGEHDYCYTWIYNASDSDFLYYGWFDNSVGWKQVIEKDKWNLIYMTNSNDLRSDGDKATAHNVTGFKLTFMAAYSKTSPDKKSSNANAEADLYISNIRAMSESVLRERLALTSDNSAQALNETLTYYRLCDTQTKNAFTDYSLLVMNKFNAVIERTKAALGTATTLQALESVDEEVETLESVYKFAPKLVQTTSLNKLDGLRAEYVNKFVSLVKDETQLESIKAQVQKTLYRYAQITTTQTISADFASEYNEWLTAYGVASNGNEIVRLGSSAAAFEQIRWGYSYSSGIRDEDGNSINAIDWFDNIAVEYTTEKKYGTENGSTKVKFPTQSGYGSVSATLVMPTLTEVSSYETLSFYVYHESEETFTFRFDGQDWVQVESGVWTKISIPVADLTDKTDIRGLAFNFYNGDWHVDANTDLYFSSIVAE